MGKVDKKEKANRINKTSKIKKTDKRNRIKNGNNIEKQSTADIRIEEKTITDTEKSIIDKQEKSTIDIQQKTNLNTEKKAAEKDIKENIEEKETEVAIIKPLSEKQRRRLKRDIARLPLPSFNNPEKVQPAVEVLKPITSELEKNVADSSTLETVEKQIIDSEVILNSKGAKLEKVHKPKKVRVFKTFAPYIKKHWYYLLFCFLFALLYSTFEVLIPIFLGRAIDTMVGVDLVNFSLLSKNILYLILSIIGFAVFRWLTIYSNNVLSFKTDMSVRVGIFKRINKTPLKYIDTTSHGDLQSRMINDVDQTSNGFLLGITTVFDALVSIVLTLVLMFKINVSISIVIVALTPISVVSTAIIAYYSHKYFRRQAKLLGDTSGLIVEMIGTQKVIKSFNYEEKSIERFEKVNKELGIQNEKANFYSAISNPLSRFINGVIYGIVAIMGVLYAIKGHISIGSIAVLLSFANRYIQPFNEISEVLNDLQAAYASARRVVNVLELEQEESDENNKKLLRINGKVEFNQVSFSYTENKKLIENLNLKIKKGQRVAIVGPTGSGKSTLINLLMRFYDVNKGEVVISNNNITKLTRDSLRSKFGMVLQESWLFNMSIKDNIRYGRPDATDKEVIRAAKRAYAHDYILTLEKGYDTIVSEGGENLSQGQKQLICIARVMLTSPPMLILDEATSNVDTRTELHIQNAFNRMMKGRTSFVVAHRLSTIIKSDVILVMNKGNIVEQGSHNELLEKKGFYYTLYNSQFSKV